MLIVFDAKNKQHVVFEKNTSNYYPYMTMKMDKSYPLKEFGYTEDGNKKINSAFGVTIEAKKKNEKPEEVLVISYGSLAEVNAFPTLHLILLMLIIFRKQKQLALPSDRKPLFHLSQLAEMYLQLCSTTNSLVTTW